MSCRRRARMQAEAEYLKIRRHAMPTGNAPTPADNVGNMEPLDRFPPKRISVEHFFVKSRVGAVQRRSRNGSIARRRQD